MAKLVYALNQSLDGYVDHDKFAPDKDLFRHFIDDVRSLAGSIYGRRMYEIMRYWDDDQEGWGEAERDYAAAWRAMPKHVVSRTLAEVGPNAVLIGEDPAARIAELKEETNGTIEIAGTVIADSMADLVDEYRIYLHPVVLGDGKPYFAGPRPRLRLVATEPFGESVLRLTYVPD